MEKISKLISEMKFRKRTFGGVDEADVWKKIELLQKEYENQLEIQKQKYQSLLEATREEDEKI